MKSPARKPAPAAELRGVLDRDVQAAGEKLEARDRIDVHAVRKHIKHARSIARLLRYELEPASYERINLGLRNAARPLARTRDTEVLISVISRLERKHDVTSLRPLHAALLREQRKSRRSSTVPRQSHLAKRRLEPLRRLIAKLDLSATTDDSAIIAAAGHTYRRARKAFRKAQATPSSENLHEWRKQVKYLWHQVQILTPLAPRAHERLAHDLHRLADHLGDDHDLAVLAARIDRGKEVARDCRDDLATLITRRRKRLERKAADLGARLFADKPKRFERKLAQRSRKPSRSKRIRTSEALA